MRTSSTIRRVFLVYVCPTLAKYQLWILLLLAPLFLFPVPDPVLSLALLTIPTLWMCHRLAQGYFFRRTVLDLPVLFLLLTLPLTLWATALPDRTTTAVSALLLGIAVLYAVTSWADSEMHLRQVVWAMTILGVGLAVVAPFGVDWFVEQKLRFVPAAIYRYMPLLLSDPIHPNIMAGALVVLLPLPVSTWLLAKDDLIPHERWLLGLSSLLMVVILVLTKSRGGYLALAASIGLIAVVRRSRRFVGIILLLLGGASFAIWRVGWISFADFISQTGSMHGLAGRMEIWSRALYMIQDFPFTGIGMGTFGPVADTLYPFFLASPGQIPHAHNLFLQVTVDLGIPGLVAFVAMLSLGSVSAIASYRTFLRAGKRWLAALCVGSLASLVAFMVQGLLDAALWNSKPAFIPWIVLGLIAALHNLQAENWKKRERR